MIVDEEETSPSDEGEADGEERIGYGKPPKATRFKPGRSGNPRGRPKGAKGHKQIVEEIAGEMHNVMEGDTMRRYSTLELILLSLRNRAAAADVRAFKAYTDLHARFGPQEPETRGGCIVVPEVVTEEEWEALFSPKDGPIG
jgi:hypothetical protein